MVNWNRELAAHSWSKMSPPDRADWFRDAAMEEVRRRYRRLRTAGLHRDDDDEPKEFHTVAINRFVDLALVQERDDDEACDAVCQLLGAIDGECRGIVPDILLYHRGGGPRVRAAMLKGGYVAGNTAGALYAHAISRSVLRDYFREAGHALLMDGDEIATVASLRAAGPTVRIYRGTNGSKEAGSARHRGMSWTRDRTIAERFANGKAWGNTWTAVLTCDYPVNHILALWETSGAEPEVVIDPTKARNIVCEQHTYVELRRQAA